MGTTINAYSVSLGLDASSFIDSAKLTRSETRALVKDIEAAQTPFEKFAVEQERLKRALDSGAISQGTYNRLLKEKRPTISDVTSSLGPYGIALGAIAAGITAAGATTVAFIGHMREAQNAIDDTADKAARLGVSFSELKSLEFGFKEGAGVDAQTVDDSIKKMQINMAKAVHGDEKTREAFAKIGLDAGELMGKAPKEAMLDIADAMSGVETHAERLKLSMEIFGKSGSDLASTLGQGRDALESSMGFAEKWLGLTEEQVAAVGSNNDAWDRIGVVIEGVTNMVAAELAPVMELVADAILSGTDGFSTLDENIRAAVDFSAQVYGHFYDTFEVVAHIASKLEAMASLDFAEAAKAAPASVMEFDTAEKLLAELEKKREAARQSAAENEKRTQDARHAQAMEDTEAETKKKEEAAKKIAEQEKRLREQAEKEANRQAENALKNAEKYFEEERRLQMKMHDDVAKGPGAGMEAGSAEAARFLAQQANQAIADATVAVGGKPTDEELVAQAKIQSELMRAAQVKQDQVIAGIRELTGAVENNGFEAVGR